MRFLAYEILYQIEKEEAFSSDVLDYRLKMQKDLSALDRGLVTEIVYGTLRQSILIDEMLTRFIKLKKTDLRILVILRLSFYQIFFLNRIPDYAVVNESVNLAKKFKRHSFVNAVLRNALRQIKTLQVDFIEVSLEELSASDWVKQSYLSSLPAFIIELLLNQYPLATAKAFAQSFNIEPRPYLRINFQGENEEEFLEKLEKDLPGLEKIPEAPYLITHRQGDLRHNEAYLQGAVSQQDLGSYLTLAPFLKGDYQPQAKVKVLDLCAGHGGKSAILAEHFGDELELWVYDKVKKKLKKLEKNFERLKLELPKRLEGDLDSWDGFFDVLLIDAPCSGLGTLARKPELKSRRQPEDLQRFSEIQIEIVKNYERVLKKGGLLIYVVCSFAREEKEPVINYLQGQDYELLLSKELLPPVDHCDAFSYAYFRK